MNKVSRLDYLDFAKLCLMFIVILSHSIKVANDDWFHLGITGIPALKYLSDWFTSFHVQSFTMISGYLFYFLFIEKSKYADLKQFVRNKFDRLLVPCIFVLCCWIIPINSVLFHMGKKEIIHCFLLLENPSQLWFLVMLFGVFLVARCAGRFPERHPVIWISVVTVSYFAGTVSGKFIPDIFQIWTILQYLIFFYLGFYYRGYIEKYGMEKYWWGLLTADIAVFLILKSIPVQAGLGVYAALRLAVGFILKITGCLMAFTCLGKLGKAVYVPGGKLTFFVNRSMVIYLVHNQFNFLTVNLLYKSLPVWALILVSFAVTVVCSTLLSSVLLHFKLTRKLVGE